MSRLLALDQSSRITGWAIFEDQQLIKYGKFDATKATVGDRLVAVRAEIQRIINEYNIDEAVIEDIQEQNGNVTTFKVLAEVYGVLEELFTELKIPYQTVFASSWKSTCGIKGRTRPEQKRNAQLYVVTNYNLKLTQDECDAICIGVHAIKQKKSTFNWD